VGAPPGYVGYEEGGQLTEAVRRRPYQVILLDEIEKAHPDVFNVLLQVLDDGRLTDGQGRTVDFKNTVVIMTSNVGSQFIAGFTTRGDAGDESAYEAMKAHVIESLRLQFRPEFLNRVDEIIIFEPLTQAELDDVVELMLQEVEERLTDRRVTVEVTAAAKKALVEEGYDPTYGARPLRRVVERQVESALARRILAGEFAEGDHVLVDYVEGEGYTFAKVKEAVAAAAP